MTALALSAGSKSFNASFTKTGTSFAEKIFILKKISQSFSAGSKSFNASFTKTGTSFAEKFLSSK